MKLKRGLILSAVCIVALFSLAQVASAADGTLTGVGGGGLGPYQAGSGGEFTWYVTGSLAPLVDLYVDTKTSNVLGSNSKPNFQSFCVEDNEYIYFDGRTYNAFLNSAAVHGGIGGGDPDPLSKGTAFLYEQFAKGTLSGYDYGAGRLTSAAELQNAIWYLEDEAGNPGNTFSNLAISTFGSFSAAHADNNGQFGVAVLNLYNPDGSPAQDQLILTAVPEPGSMHLLALGLFGLIGVARRRVK